MIEPTDKIAELKSLCALVGQTIMAIERRAENAICIDFNDGTEIMILANAGNFYSSLVIHRKLSKACTACNGDGYYDSDDNPKCGACNGTGIESADR